MTSEGGVYAAVRVADKILAQLSPAKGEITSLALRCAENTALGTFRVESPLDGRLEITHPAILMVELDDRDAYAPIESAVARKADTFSVSFPPGVSNFGLKVEFDLEDRFLIKRLVAKHHDKEPVSDDGVDSYWISAQLREVTALKTSYGKVNLKDVDFLLNVSIQNDLNTSVPKSFVRQMEVSNMLVKERNRSKKFQLMNQQLHLERVGPANSKKLIKEMQDVFVPSEFTRFVSVREDFKFREVKRGTDGKGGGLFGALPQSMMVVSNTRLDVDNPTAEGHVDYQKGSLIEELEKMFPRAMHELSKGAK